MAKEYFTIKMQTNKMESSDMVRNTEREFFVWKMETRTMENFDLAKRMEKEFYEENGFLILRNLVHI